MLLKRISRQTGKPYEVSVSRSFIFFASEIPLSRSAVDEDGDLPAEEIAEAVMPEASAVSAELAEKADSRLPSGEDEETRDEDADAEDFWK